MGISENGWELPVGKRQESIQDKDFFVNGRLRIVLAEDLSSS